MHTYDIDMSECVEHFARQAAIRFRRESDTNRDHFYSIPFGVGIRNDHHRWSSRSVRSV